MGRPVPAWASPQGDLLFYAPEPSAPTRNKDVYILHAWGAGVSPNRSVVKPTSVELGQAIDFGYARAHVEEDARFSEVLRIHGAGFTEPQSLTGFVTGPTDQRRHSIVFIGHHVLIAGNTTVHLARVTGHHAR